MSVFPTGLFERRKTVEKLIEESRADNDFYLFLIFAAFVTTLGLHMDNPIVIIGAMLIAPILFPIMSLGMGMVTSSRVAIKRSIAIILKSVAAVVIISFVTSFILNDQSITESMLNASSPNFVYFLVAFFSGIIASYSWVKQTLSSTLTGVAITVTLVPPLSAIGVAISLFSRDIFSGSVMLFVINLLGIVLASVIVFLLFGFSSLRHFEEQKISQEQVEQNPGRI